MFRIQNRNRIRFSKLILVLISLLANVLLTQAQDPYAVHYTTKEGLPTNIIYSSIIAKNGVQWFGSNKGVAYPSSQAFQYLRKTISGFDSLIKLTPKSRLGASTIVVTCGQYSSRIVRSKLRALDSSSIMATVI